MEFRVALSSRAFDKYAEGVNGRCGSWLCENGAAVAVTTPIMAARSGAGGFGELSLFSGRGRICRSDGAL